MEAVLSEDFHRIRVHSVNQIKEVPFIISQFKEVVYSAVPAITNRLPLPHISKLLKLELEVSLARLDQQP